MARPKVHQKDRKTTGLKLDEDVHQALRNHNAATGIPMNRTTQKGLVMLLTQEGFYPLPGQEKDDDAEVTSITPARAVLRKNAS